MLMTLLNETGVKVFADKTKNMFQSPDQNAGWCHNIKSDYSYFKIVEDIK